MINRLKNYLLMLYYLAVLMLIALFGKDNDPYR